MNIVLLNPRVRSWSPNLYVPVGPAYVAEGHRVSITDLNIEKVGDGRVESAEGAAGFQTHPPGFPIDLGMAVFDNNLNVIAMSAATKQSVIVASLLAPSPTCKVSYANR
jgi:hypothetical protein